VGERPKKLRSLSAERERAEELAEERVGERVLGGDFPAGKGGFGG
jgi:hypothetical protein